jgi:hypothetical protein
MQHTTAGTRPDVATFRPQTRDLYSPPGDLSFWQAAIRTTDDPDRLRMQEAMAGMGPVIVDLLYSDQDGGQRTISLTRYSSEVNEWYPTVVRHWFVDQG